MPVPAAARAARRRSRRSPRATTCEIPVVAHAGDGNTHPIIVFDPADADAEKRARARLRRGDGAAIALGGTITGEHGVGRAKKAALPDQLGPDVMALTRRIKDALDPDGILNPGAISDRLTSRRQRAIPRRWQSTRWVSTSPVASISACTVVGPTKPNPRLRSALESAIDSGEVVGTSAEVGGLGVVLGAEAVDERLEPSVVAQLDRGLGVASRGLDLGAVADDAGVGHQHVRGRRRSSRPPGRRRSRGRPRGTGPACSGSSSQDSPAWKPSRLSRSNSPRSPRTGTPHSVSW